MPRSLLEFFADESGDYLDKMERALGAGPTPDADELRRFARALRGSARMADQDAIARAAGAVQGAAAGGGTGGRSSRVAWSRRSEISAAWSIR
jgi:HPt (histidine-containing phosphotransfer) domain-containing protein